MILHKSQLNTLLTQYNIQTSSLDVLWEVDENIVYGIIVNGVDAIETWCQLYEIVSTTQHYPVLLGSKEEANAYIENSEFVEQASPSLTVSEIINIGNSLDIEEWLVDVEAQRREEWKELGIEDENEIYSFISKIDPVALEEMINYEDCVPRREYTIFKDTLTKEPYKEVVIALVPTTFSWEVPAFLKFGNWNDCPEPEVQVSVMKRWYELYGAEVVGISNDVVEMQVKNPPQDMATSLDLAKEQYIYCYDIVTQGVQTVQNLATTLLDSHIWYFWWD